MDQLWGLSYPPFCTEGEPTETSRDYQGLLLSLLQGAQGLGWLKVRNVNNEGETSCTLHGSRHAGLSRCQIHPTCLDHPMYLWQESHGPYLVEFTWLILMEGIQDLMAHIWWCL